MKLKQKHLWIFLTIVIVVVFFVVLYDVGDGENDEHTSSSGTPQRPMIHHDTTTNTIYGLVVYQNSAPTDEEFKELLVQYLNDNGITELGIDNITITSRNIEGNYEEINLRIDCSDCKITETLTNIMVGSAGNDDCADELGALTAGCQFSLDGTIGGLPYYLGPNDNTEDYYSFTTTGGTISAEDLIIGVREPGDSGGVPYPLVLETLSGSPVDVGCDMSVSSPAGVCVDTHGEKKDGQDYCDISPGDTACQNEAAACNTASGYWIRGPNAIKTDRNDDRYKLVGCVPNCTTHPDYGTAQSPVIRGWSGPTTPSTIPLSYFEADYGKINCGTDFMESSPTSTDIGRCEQPGGPLLLPDASGALAPCVLQCAQPDPTGYIINGGGLTGDFMKPADIGGRPTEVMERRPDVIQCDAANHYSLNRPSEGGIRITSCDTGPHPINLNDSCVQTCGIPEHMPEGSDDTECNGAPAGVGCNSFLQTHIRNRLTSLAVPIRKNGPNEWTSTVPTCPTGWKDTHGTEAGNAQFEVCGGGSLWHGTDATGANTFQFNGCFPPCGVGDNSECINVHLKVNPAQLMDDILGELSPGDPGYIASTITDITDIYGGVFRKGHILHIKDHAGIPYGKNVAPAAVSYYRKTLSNGDYIIEYQITCDMPNCQILTESNQEENLRQIGQAQCPPLPPGTPTVDHGSWIQDGDTAKVVCEPGYGETVTGAAGWLPAGDPGVALTAVRGEEPAWLSMVCPPASTGVPQRGWDLGKGEPGEFGDRANAVAPWQAAALTCEPDGATRATVTPPPPTGCQDDPTFSSAWGGVGCVWHDQVGRDTRLGADEIQHRQATMCDPNNADFADATSVSYRPFSQACPVTCGICDTGAVTFPGCRDASASNYNPLATSDDGSCTLPPSMRYTRDYTPPPTPTPPTPTPPTPPPPPAPTPPPPPPIVTPGSWVLQTTTNEDCDVTCAAASPGGTCADGAWGANSEAALNTALTAAGTSGGARCSSYTGSDWHGMFPAIDPTAPGGCYYNTGESTCRDTSGYNRLCKCIL
jgi:hypothetical protein